MSAFFDKFDPKVRLAMWAGLSLISLVAGWAVLSKMATGPWPALLVAAALAAIGLSMQGEAWPSKPPAWANEFIEKWKKMRSRSTKSAAGKFAWNLGRSAVAGICMWFALEQFADVSGFLAKAMILGFAVSTGFFGAGPAAWSGMVVFFVGHRLALMGLNVDFADPNSRAALDAAWSAGGAMSWWWAIGLAVAAPIWIFLSFLSRVLSTKLLDEYEEIRAAKEAKRKIDARRARLKQREEAEETDELITARLARESAERRVASVARGKDGALPNAGGAGGTEDEGEEELSAVEKLMEVKNVGQLEQYIEHAKSILQSEKDGIDVDTVGRRSFDRVVEAMDDTQLKLLRKGDLPGWEALDQYYNKLCGIEYNAMAGGDGEVITMQGERSEAAVGSGYEDDSVIGDVMTEMETLEADAAAPSVSEDEDAPLGDVLDHESGEAPVHRRTSAADEIESMLAEPKSAASVFREGPDGTPEGDVELPAASQSDNEIEESPDVPAAEGTAETEEMPMVEESEEEYSSVDRIDDIKSDAGEDDFDAFNELGDDSDDEPGLGEPVGSFDEPVDVREEPEASSGVEDETSEEVGDDADEPASEEDHFDDFLAEQDAADADADFGPDGLIEDDVEGDEPETEANTSADAANAEGETDDGEGVDATGVAAVVEAEATPEHEWEIEPKRAASRIIMRKIDRDLVLKTVGMFETIDAMADTLGLPADELDDVFEEYQAQVEGAKVEQSLDGLVSAEDVDGVREALAALEASSWEADSDAVARASAFIEAKEEEARQAEEKRLAEEQRKREEEEAERERLEAERIAEEERKREEEAAAARAEEERKEAEAEAARLAELEKDRMKHGIHLLSGQYDEELLSVGGDLFPDVETLASTLGVETRVVEKQFGVFEAKRIAKEKFEALNAAWKERDLGLVLTLLDDTSDMDAYDDPDDMISHIKSWAESEKRRQEVAGLTEKVDIGKSSQGDENQKKFIVKRCKTTDEQIDIIENLLPNALSLAESLGRVRAAMGSSAPPVMKEEEDKAVMQAARLAAMLTAEERQCKEYTMAFFPAEDGVSGPKVWDRIEAFAARSDGKAAAIERADANASSEAPKEGEKPQFAQIAIPQDSGPKLRSYEELLEADVQEEIRKIATPKVEELDWYNREYRRKFISFVNDPKDDFDVTPSGFFDVKVADGVVRLHTPLKKMPLWFEARPNDKAGDIVHVMEVVDGVSTLSTLPASVIHKQFSSHFGGESKVSAVILVSPAISQEGIRTFEKFLSGIRGGPVIILNSNLKEDDISAFLERLKNA